jgi:hypothetical protein
VILDRGIKATTYIFSPFLSYIMQVGRVREFVSTRSHLSVVAVPVTPIATRFMTLKFIFSMCLSSTSPLRVCNSVVGGQNDMISRCNYDDGSTFALMGKR